MGEPGAHSESKTPRATVVVTACSVERGLPGTLAAVRAQADAADAEVLLVFNVAEDEIPADDLDGVAPLVDRVLFEPRPGKSVALNSAVEAAGSEIVAFTDDDAVPREGWLEAVVAPFEADGTLEGVGGRVVPVFPDAPPPAWYVRLVRRKPSHFLGPKHDLGDAEIDYELPLGDSISPVPLGANCAWRRSVLLRIPYREELGPNRATGMRGGEDTCLALEVLAAGGRIRYVPDAIVEHPVEPERMTRDYVIEGFRRQGREYGTVMRTLGRTVADPARMRRAANRGEDAWWLRTLQGPYKTFKRELRREFAREVCSSLSLQ